MPFLCFEVMNNQEKKDSGIPENQNDLPESERIAIAKKQLGGSRKRLVKSPIRKDGRKGFEQDNRTRKPE